uniref:Uncharacterized protein n=1 Tax=Dactylella sp. TaxID=1814903 RepID=A0A482DU11_9PEZI|nr:hypothetical protein [Dactylella sp.]
MHNFTKKNLRTRFYRVSAKAHLSVPQELHNIIIGSMLGDFKKNTQKIFYSFKNKKRKKMNLSLLLSCSVFLGLKKYKKLIINFLYFNSMHSAFSKCLKKVIYNLILSDKVNLGNRPALNQSNFGIVCFGYSYFYYKSSHLVIFAKNRYLCGPIRNSLVFIRGFRTSGFNSLNSTQYTVEKIYHNTDKEKKNIIKDNRNKTGVYCWTNLENGKNM